MKKVLFFQWNALMQKDVEKALLARKDIEVDMISYEFADLDYDSYFEKRFPEHLLKKAYDMVFSINFFPVLSDICNRYQILYVSWVYDAPMNIRRKETIGNTFNRVFLFDNGQYQDFLTMGYNNQVYHMPLGVNVSRLDKMDITPAEREFFSSSASFVGKLYENDFDYLLSPLPETYKEKLLEIAEEQKNVYGHYFLNDVFTPELISQLNTYYAIASGNTFQVKKEELEYACATYITQLERLEILKTLSKECTVDLYSYNQPENLPEVKCKGIVKYYSQMPKVFRCSKINLNISLKIIREGIPLRVFDILGAGGFLISNYQTELEECFTLDKDLVVYKSIEELREKVKYYLGHEEERKTIAKNGHDKVAKYYSIEGQLEKIFKQALA